MLPQQQLHLLSGAVFVKQHFINRNKDRNYLISKQQLANRAVILVFHDCSNDLQHRCYPWKRSAGKWCEKVKEKVQMSRWEKTPTTSSRCQRPKMNLCTHVPVPPAIIPTYFTFLVTGWAFFSGRIANSPGKERCGKQWKSLGSLLSIFQLTDIVKQGQKTDKGELKMSQRTTDIPTVSGSWRQTLTWVLILWVQHEALTSCISTCLNPIMPMMFRSPDFVSFTLDKLYFLSFAFSFVDKQATWSSEVNGIPYFQAV